MEKLNDLENILHILDKKPQYKLSITIDGVIETEEGNNINKILDTLVNMFLKKYNTVNLSISPINALQEYCIKNKLETPCYTFAVIDNKFHATCIIKNHIVHAEHSKKKYAKKQVSLDMLKLLIKNS